MFQIFHSYFRHTSPFVLQKSAFYKLFPSFFARDKRPLKGSRGDRSRRRRWKMRRPLEDRKKKSRARRNNRGNLGSVSGGNSCFRNSDFFKDLRAQIHMIYCDEVLRCWEMPWIYGNSIFCPGRSIFILFLVYFPFSAKKLHARSRPSRQKKISAEIRNLKWNR